MRHRVLELVCEGEPCHSGLFQWGAPGYVALNVGSTVMPQSPSSHSGT